MDAAPFALLPLPHPALGTPWVTFWAHAPTPRCTAATSTDITNLCPLHMPGSRKGLVGGCFMIMDATSRADLPAGVSDIRMPQWMLPTCLHIYYPLIAQIFFSSMGSCPLMIHPWIERMQQQPHSFLRTYGACKSTVLFTSLSLRTPLNRVMTIPLPENAFNMQLLFWPSAPLDGHYMHPNLLNMSI